MSKEQASIQQNTNQTFRNFGESLGISHQNKNQGDEILNSTNQNSLRYSTLITTSHANQSRNAGIICPTHNQAGVYKCQICSGLRQVCPRTRTKIFSKEKQEKNVNVSKSVTSNNINLNTNLKQGLRQLSNIQTNNMNSNMLNPHIKIVAPGSYIQRPKSFSTYQYLRKNWNYTPNFANETSNNKRTYVEPNFNYRPPTANIPSSRIYAPHSSIGYSHVNQYGNIPTQKLQSRTQLIQQIIYVPVIHNIIKPEIINPEHADYQRELQKTQDIERNKNKYKISQPEASPIKTKRNYDQQILTPQGMRKLAESIIR